MQMHDTRNKRDLNSFLDLEGKSVEDRRKKKLGDRFRQKKGKKE